MTGPPKGFARIVYIPVQTYRKAALEGWSRKQEVADESSATRTFAKTGLRGNSSLVVP